MIDTILSIELAFFSIIQSFFFPNTNVITPIQKQSITQVIEKKIEKPIQVSVDQNFITKIRAAEQKRLKQLVHKYKHLTMPKIVKGIYMTSDSFVLQKNRDRLVKLIESTELNSAVIDMRDRHGKLIFKPKNKLIQDTSLSKIAIERKDIKKILDELQNKNIYTIARITTFQDTYSAQKFPELALKKSNGRIWYNHLDIAWLDMTNPDSWNIPLAYAQEAIDLGFDEIQFDYIRFPSDGYLQSIKYKNQPLVGEKWKVMKDVFAFLESNIRPQNIPISADLFGFAYHKSYLNKDLNIGQRVVDATDHFDALSGMIYASHYSPNYMGFKNPANFPGPIVAKAMESGEWLRAQSPNSKAQDRPWIQDFNLGAFYDAKKVRAQIDAVENANGGGWLLWNARNVYTSGALKKTKVLSQ